MRKFPWNSLCEHTLAFLAEHMSLATKRSIIFSMVEDQLNPEIHVEYPDKF